MKLCHRVVASRAILTVTLGGDDGEGWLWWIEDEDFRYTHWVQCGQVENDDVRGIQVVIGPLLISLAWNKEEKTRCD